MYSNEELAQFEAWYQGVKGQAPVMFRFLFGMRCSPAERPRLGPPIVNFGMKSGALMLWPGGLVFLRKDQLSVGGAVAIVAGGLGTLALVAALVLVPALASDAGVDFLNEYGFGLGIALGVPVVAAMLLIARKMTTRHVAAAEKDPPIRSAPHPESIFIPLERVHRVEVGPQWGEKGPPSLRVFYADVTGQPMQALFASNRGGLGSGQGSFSTAADFDPAAWAWAVKPAPPVILPVAAAAPPVPPAWGAAQKEPPPTLPPLPPEGSPPPIPRGAQRE